MASASIEVRGLTHQFAQHQVLKNVSLSVQRGESLVLIGPSGQGKSLLLKSMAGIQPPVQGNVFVDGVDLYQAPIHERTQVMRRMGMLFQKNALFDSLSVGENIAFPLREVGGGIDEAEIQRRVDFFLDAVKIAHARDLFPDEISGGMQKRLGIARALALYPQIILYDDPTAGLDPITSRHIIDLILLLKKQNKSTVVAITNDMNRAYQMADRIAMVVDGGVVITGTVEQTKTHSDPRVRQFISGALKGPLTAEPV